MLIRTEKLNYSLCHISEDEQNFPMGLFVYTRQKPPKSHTCIQQIYQSLSRSLSKQATHTLRWRVSALVPRCRKKIGSKTTKVSWPFLSDKLTHLHTHTHTLSLSWYSLSCTKIFYCLSLTQPHTTLPLSFSTTHRNKILSAQYRGGVVKLKCNGTCDVSTR